MLAFLHPLPVQALWGVGPEDPREAPPARGRHRRRPGRPRGAIGARRRWAPPTAPTCGSWPWASTTATSIPHQKAKSIGHEETFAHDHHSLESLQRQLVRLGDSVAQRLRAAGVAGRTVTIKVRFHDFRTITRSVTLAVRHRHRTRRGAGRHRAAPEGRSHPRGAAARGPREPAGRRLRPPAQPRRRRGAVLGRRHRGHRRHPGPLRARCDRAGVADRARRASGSRSGATSSGDPPTGARCRPRRPVER